MKVVRDVKASQKKVEHLSRAAPAANLLLPPSDPYDCILFSLLFCTHSGDLSKVQWPAALKELNLNDCGQMTGSFQPLAANEHQQTTSRAAPSRKPSSSSS